jgi:nocturnin
MIHKLKMLILSSYQIGLSATLKSKKTGQEVVFATTHLKARNGALMPTLRNEQVKDLLGFLVDQAGKRPVICCGDFNAQPDEPAYQTMTSSRDLRFVFLQSL